MTRDPSWPTMLASFIEARRRVPFAWGVNDCCLFGADWVRLCTGVDLAGELRGSYSSALGAARVLNGFGGINGVVRALGGPLGIASTPIASAQRGDLIAQDQGNGECLGVVVGSVAAFVSKDGLTFAPFRAKNCWKV